MMPSLWLDLLIRPMHYMNTSNAFCAFKATWQTRTSEGDDIPEGERETQEAMTKSNSKTNAQAPKQRIS
jgi:hypothetical protein